MASSHGRIYYMNNIEQQVYRLNDYGFDIKTNEKRVIIKNLETGERWDMPQSALAEVRLIDGRSIPVWEEMPDGWHPVKERSYPGYTNDPRTEVEVRDGYDVYGRRIDNTGSFTGYSGRERIGFRR